MPVLVRSRSPYNPRDTPVLVVTLRRRVCAECGRPAHVTLWSPSTFMTSNMAAGLVKTFGGPPPLKPLDGQCCIRCTRRLRS